MMGGEVNHTSIKSRNNKNNPFLRDAFYALVGAQDILITNTIIS
jgi:hypothetical protein